MWLNACYCDVLFGLVVRVLHCGVGLHANKLPHVMSCFLSLLQKHLGLRGTG